MTLTNLEVAKKLRQVAAAYSLKGGNLFQIRAYESAADSIEHLTSEIKDIWEDSKLNDIPGVGESLQAHLDELLRTGKVRHWQEIKQGIPEGFFEFLDISGVGPKTAQKLASLGAKNLYDLKQKLLSGELVEKGLGKKSAGNILSAISKPSLGDTGRMLLPYAYMQAEKVLDYLKAVPFVERADVLGSLRRMVATVGDLDFAVTSEKPAQVIGAIVKMPGVLEVLDKGTARASVISSSGLRLDFIVVGPQSYGALLQHFTGSKQHNIHLRTVAETKGLSLSEYGVKDVKTGKIKGTATEEEFYGLLGMEVPPPEIREDTGEIEAAMHSAQGKPNGLPDLVKLSDIKGDFHIHDNFPIEPSHDLGQNTVAEIAEKAKQLGYEYVGISDHSPSTSKHSKDEIVQLIKQHSNVIEHYNSSNKFRVLNLLEVDIQPDGRLSVPDEGLKLLDFAIASVHSLHRMEKDEMTKRIMKALENPYVKVFGHPTGRLINKRESYEADWQKIFELAAKKHIAMEINGYPDRLDLPDYLVREARQLGVKMAVDTDSHEISSMDQMKFGVSVARRGWASKEDIINTWDLKKVLQWFNISS